MFEQYGRIAVEVFALRERAELLGAIFGDGSIEERSHYGRRVSVGVSDRLLPWKERVEFLFDAVFGKGRASSRSRKNPKTGVTYYEFYTTTHEVMGIFGVDGKYNSKEQIVPPSWVQEHPELLRLFIRGLVETDGCFTREKDGTVTFLFSQKNDYLTAWFVETLCNLGYPCRMCWAEQAQVNMPTINFAEAVKRFGEWLKSDKWLALLERGESVGWTPRSAVVNRKGGGVPLIVRERKILQSVPLHEQDRWRELRTMGASIGAIAQHVGRSNTVVMDAVGDIIPATPRAAEDLNLKPLVHYPKNVSTDIVERWRAAALAGDSGITISKRENVPEATINKATCDIRWDQLLAKREAQKNKLTRMKAESQGDGRWKGEAQE